MDLLYVGDPMCSWCWGFAPVLRTAVARYAVDLTIVVGGLRPGTAARTLDAELRRHLEHHWAQVERTSGQPFNRATLDREGWPYDTELGCRAVVTARRQAPERALALFEIFQAAFYRDALDLTEAETYRPLVATAGLDADTFLTEMRSEAIRNETYRDFARSRRLGVQGFPSLLLIDGETRKLRLDGYRPFEALTEAFDRVGVPLREPEGADRAAAP